MARGGWLTSHDFRDVFLTVQKTEAKSLFELIINERNCPDGCGNSEMLKNEWKFSDTMGTHNLHFLGYKL